MNFDSSRVISIKPRTIKIWYRVRLGERGRLVTRVISHDVLSHVATFRACRTAFGKRTQAMRPTGTAYDIDFIRSYVKYLIGSKLMFTFGLN